jgi:DNA-binding response OmpR family regulator
MTDDEASTGILTQRGDAEEAGMSSDTKRILIAQEHDAARDILKALLIQAGYSVQETRNGREAREEMQRKQFDVVVTDRDMPDLNGRELLAFGRIAWPHIPIIILSEEPAEPSDDVHALGAYAWIVKPYDTWLLLETIRNAAHVAARKRCSELLSPT